MQTDLINCVHAAYGITVRNSTPIALDSSPVDAYRLHTTSGDYLLKPIPNYRPLDSFAAAAMLQVYLMSSGAPVAPFIATLSGDVICSAPFGPATLQSWLPGRHGRPGSVADCLATVEALVCSLAAGQELRGEARTLLSQRLDPNPWPDTASDWELITAALESAAASHCSRLQEKASKLAKAVFRLCAQVAWNRLTLGIIHGDPGPDNTIFVGDDALLIDFDDARQGFRLLDPARAVAEYAVEAAVEAAAVTARLDMAFVLAMIREGCGLTDASPFERAAWEPLLRLSMVSALFGRVNLDWELNAFDPPDLMCNPTALDFLIDVAGHALGSANSG